MTRNARGQVTPANKDLDEFRVALLAVFRNRIVQLITLSRSERNLVSTPNNCLVEFMKRAKNNQNFSALRLKDLRRAQEWGE